MTEYEDIKKVKAMMGYIHTNYPKEFRYVKNIMDSVIYLADWRHAIKHKKQISEIQWFLSIGRYPKWDIPSEYCKSRHQKEKENLSEEEKETLDHVIKETKEMDESKLFLFKRSIYPSMKSEEGSNLYLDKLAEEYREKYLDKG